MNEIVVLGASGAVGSRVARLLAPEFGDRLRLVGRRPEALRAQAAELGARWAVADLEDQTAVRAAARGARVAVLGVEGHVEAARTLLTEGVSFLDVGATPEHLAQLAGLDGLARAHGATGVLSVGIAPGASNLLAHAAARAAGSATRIDITVMLGGAERHGPAAVRWTVDSLLDAAPGSPARVVALPGPDGRVRRRRTAEFPFADAPVVAATLDARVTTRLTLDSRLAGTSLRALGLLRRTPWRDSVALRSLLTRALSGVHLGGEVFTVRADAWGTRHAAAAITGRGQTRATAAVAARVARSLVPEGSSAGVVHLPELPGSATLLDDLAATGTWQHLALTTPA